MRNSRGFRGVAGEFFVDFPGGGGCAAVVRFAQQLDQRWGAERGVGFGGRHLEAGQRVDGHDRQSGLTDASSVKINWPATSETDFLRRMGRVRERRGFEGVRAPPRCRRAVPRRNL